MRNSDSSDTSDLVWGGAAIPKVIGRPRAAVYHMLVRGYLPARRVGGHWVASRERLLALADPEVESAA